MTARNSRMYEIDERIHTLADSILQYIDPTKHEALAKVEELRAIACSLMITGVK